ncbi:unnamed protein product [Linum tenue]|uniref:Uncharacterized protein n=1 Tax=Linum tenue TaxID=586396 RepID=A0AAV0H655_9ROSI|nr:unnamed protein product [Linum tenue]
MVMLLSALGLNKYSTLSRLLPAGAGRLRVLLITPSSPTLPSYYSSKEETEDDEEKAKQSGKKFKERLSDVKTAAKFVRDVANSDTDSYKMDKDTKETITKVKEAAETVKDGVNDVKKTTKFVRNIASSTADTVKKLAKEATDKVSNSAIQATTEIVKDKVKGKFD